MNTKADNLLRLARVGEDSGGVVRVAPTPPWDGIARGMISIRICDIIVGSESPYA